MPAALVRDGPAAATKQLQRLISLFGRERVVMELWDHGDPLDSARNDALAEIAARHDVVCVATNDVHYATPQHRRLATALSAVRARRSLAEQLREQPSLGNPRDSGDYLRARLRHLPYEVFGCLYLDNRHRVLAFEELFRGTVDGASVHPREVVRACLQHNACAVIFAHNHPSGVAEPSAADRAITHELRDALQLVGVRVLDHLVIGSGEPVSMAARGLI